MEHRVFRKGSFSSLMKIVLLLALNLRGTVNADGDNDKELCFHEDSIDLINKLWNVANFCVESGYFFSSEIVRNTSDVLLHCMCDVESCGSLCFTSTNALAEASGTEFQEQFSLVYETKLAIEGGGNSTLAQTEQFHFFVWSPCDVHFLLIVNSRWYIEFQNDTNTIFNWQKYCLYRIFNGTIHDLHGHIRDYNFKYINYGGIISIPFLTATIIVYSILPELRNIHGKIFRCYLCCNVVTYIIFVVRWRSDWHKNYPTLCNILGFSLYFSSITSFLWLNVVCFDMWRKFGSCVASQGRRNLHERKKLVSYSIYACGTGALLTGVCIGMELWPNLPEWVIRPDFQSACWFVSSDGAYLYYYAPIRTSIIGSICLFVLTSVKIIKQKIEMRQQLKCEDSQRHDDDNFPFSLYLKLSIIMGACWSLDFLPHFWPDSAVIWYTKETMLGLQGVLIFVVFVCKKKIRQLLKKRFDCRSL